MDALWLTCGVSREMISHIEGGESIPTLHVAARLAHDVEVTLTEFVEPMAGEWERRHVCRRVQDCQRILCRKRHWRFGDVFLEKLARGVSLDRTLIPLGCARSIQKPPPARVPHVLLMIRG